MAVKRASKQIKYGIIRQNPSNAAATAYLAIGNTANQWTNPGLAATNYRTVYYNKGVPVPDPAVTISDYGLSSQLGLNKELTNYHIDARSGLAKLNFSAPADVLTLAPHLMGALQAGSDNAGEYDFVSGFTAGPIDFNGGGGFLHTLAINQGASADDGIILENAVIDNLSLTFDFIQKGIARLVGITGTWVGNEMNFEQTLSGTWVSTTMTPLNNTDVFSFNTFTSDSVDWSALCVRRMVFNINNNVTSNCATTAGKPNQYDFSPVYGWTVVLDHNSTTEKMMGDFQAGAAVDINMKNSITPGQAGFLTIDTPYCRIAGNPYTYNGDFLGYAIPLEAFQSSTTSPVTILLFDGLTWGYF